MSIYSFQFMKNVVNTINIYIRIALYSFYFVRNVVFFRHMFIQLKVQARHASKLSIRRDFHYLSNSNDLSISKFIDIFISMIFFKASDCIFESF